MVKIIKFLLLTILFGCWGCSEEKESPTNEYATIETGINQLTFERDGGEKIVTFTTSNEWTTSVVSEGKWVKVFPTNGGKGTNTITITAQFNDEKVERKATFKIVSGKATKSISITQTNDKTTSIEEQRDALIKFYEATNGDEWTNNTNWLSTKPLSEWYGIKTDQDGKVRYISLHSNNLKGSIPEEIGMLQNLDGFYVSHNQLEGKLPKSFFSINELSYTNLSYTQLTGPISKFCQLKNLEQLYMYGSQFIGPLPENINELTKLTWLGLQDCPITGTIPESLGELSNLDHIYFRNCQLEGPIPESIGKLSKLIYFDVSYNNHTGNIPTSIGQMASLEHLSLNDNQLEGTIPESIGDLSKLVILNMSNNQLTGSIPSSIGKLINLEELNLSFNQLSGNIPDEIVNLVNLYNFTLQDNPNLTGLPQNTSIMELPCWQDQWWRTLLNTGIEVPIEEGQIPGPSFKVNDLDGNRIVSEDEYQKNKYTILIQWNPSDQNSQKLIATLIEYDEKYAEKGLGIIGWCREAQEQYSDIKDYIQKQGITWKNFISTEGNRVTKYYSEYPSCVYGLTVHVVNSDNRVVFSSLVSDVNTLPDFLEEAFAE